eukprot:scaffold215972_cov36-Tisochrysis_lutea.AAC.1
MTTWVIPPSASCLSTWVMSGSPPKGVRTLGSTPWSSTPGREATEMSAVLTPSGKGSPSRSRACISNMSWLLAEASVPSARIALASLRAPSARSEIEHPTSFASLAKSMAVTLEVGPPANEVDMADSSGA